MKHLDIQQELHSRKLTRKNDTVTHRPGEQRHECCQQPEEIWESFRDLPLGKTGSLAILQKIILGVQH